MRVLSKVLLVGFFAVSAAAPALAQDRVGDGDGRAIARRETVRRIDRDDHARWGEDRREQERRIIVRRDFDRRDGEDRRFRDERFEGRERER